MYKQIKFVIFYKKLLLIVSMKTTKLKNSANIKETTNKILSNPFFKKF